MDQVNNLEKDLEQLENYIKYLEKQKKQLEKENMKKRMIIEELKQQNEE